MLWSRFLLLAIVMVAVGIAAGVIASTVAASFPKGHSISVELQAKMDKLPEGNRVVTGKILVSCSGYCEDVKIIRIEIYVLTLGGSLVTSCDLHNTISLRSGTTTIPITCFETLTLAPQAPKYLVEAFLYTNTGEKYATSVEVGAP